MGEEGRPLPLQELSRPHLFCTICPKTITLQHLVFGQLTWAPQRKDDITEIGSGSCLVTGDLSTIISCEFGPLGETISGAVM